jgi:hypothetical protein
MQIEFVRSGGFAGPATNVTGKVEFDGKSASVTSAGTAYRRELSSQEADLLSGSAEPSVLGKAKSALAAQSAAPDAFQFEITIVSKDGKRHAITVGAEGGSEKLKTAAPELAPLVSWVGQEVDRIWSYRLSQRK